MIKIAVEIHGDPGRGAYVTEDPVLAPLTTLQLIVARSADDPVLAPLAAMEPMAARTADDPALAPFAAKGRLKCVPRGVMPAR